ncbi:MAG TPA: alpha/beta fold hydrolase, partial [Alphaproteobacteria bacterium]|nr:alpha/beta fold hydrolase [Alphaproteobacteria bacterium]
MYHGFETLRVDNEFGVRDIPYSKSEKSSDKRDYRPSVFIIPPMNGTMWEAKSVALRERFAQHDEGCVAFGYSDLNDTTARRVDFSIYRSIDDTRQMFERITEGPQIVVASSFGATAALKLAQQYPERVAGLVLIAPGVSINKQMLKKHLADEKRRLDYETKGFAEMHVFSYPNPENTGVSASKIKKYRVQKAELDKAAREEVIKPRKKIVLECPVLIIH